MIRREYGHHHVYVLIKHPEILCLYVSVKRSYTLSQNASPSLIEILSVPLCKTSTLSVLV